MYEFWVWARNTSCQLLFTASNRLAGHATSEWASSHYHMNESRLSLSHECVSSHYQIRIACHVSLSITWVSLLSLSDPYCLPCHTHEWAETSHCEIIVACYVAKCRIRLVSHVIHMNTSHPTMKFACNITLIDQWRVALHNSYRLPCLTHEWNEGHHHVLFPCYITHMKDSSDTIKSLLPGTSQKSTPSPTSLCCLHAQQHSLSARDNVSSC